MHRSVAVPIPYDAPLAQALMQEMADDLASLYGPGSYPAQDPAHWAAPDGALFVLRVGDEPVGCGGFIRHDRTTAELKRMYVRPPWRREGRARALLDVLEAEALRLGYGHMVLETGGAQVAARKLYVQAGYAPCPCWPPHDGDPTSVCFRRELGSPATHPAR